MNVNEALSWRYATKRMNGNAVPENIIDEIITACHLSPSGIGLQPYELIVITDPELRAQILPIASNQPQVVECSHLIVFAAWNDYTPARIDNVFDHLATSRGISTTVNDRQRNFAKEYFAKFTKGENFHHSAKQAHIALGIAVLTASLNKVDNTPMEGFDSRKLDELLDLPSKGLRSSMLLALGYRDSELDWNLPLKKVRKPIEEFLSEYR